MKTNIILMCVIVAALCLTTTPQHETPSIVHAMKSVIDMEVSMIQKSSEVPNLQGFNNNEISLPEAGPNLLLAHDGPTDENGCHEDEKGRWH